MNYILSFDTQLFFLINHAPHPPALNFLAQALSGLGSGGFIFIMLGLFLFLHEEKRDHWFLIPLCSAIGISFFISDMILKTYVARIRPEDLAGALIIGLSPETYSFPSTHTTVAFAGAVVLSWKEPRWWWVWYSLAVGIAFSRIYLGYHYPIDVVVGAAIGYTLAKSIIFLTQSCRHNPCIRLLFGKKMPPSRHERVR